MPLVLKADDALPWGKHVGETLRSVYQCDHDYYEKLLIKTDDIIINEKTQEILASNLDVEDLSYPTFSKGARLTKTELKINDTLVTGNYAGYTLKEVFDENESYFRFLVQGKVYFVSESTFEHLCLLKYGENYLKKKRTREEQSELIDRKINGFSFSEDDDFSDADLAAYLGGEVLTDYSEETYKQIHEDQENDAYDLQEELESVYGKYAKFRPGQEEAILSVLNGKRTLIVQHTGWGKSLVYFMSIKKLRQMGKGPAIIISPLLALMHNQIDATKKFGINIKAISSDNQKEWPSIYLQIDLNKVDAIIISPERLGNESFASFLNKNIRKVSLFVVDEAHCISDWGHDFRPDFRRIIRVIRRLPGEVPVLATTATANDRVVRDIKHQLGEDLEISRGTMERSTLNIDVLTLGSDYRKRSWLLRNIPKFKGVGIIYCLTVRACEEVTEFLQDQGINAEIYHAQLRPSEKIETENRFQNNEIKVLVATIAFGMGIDKPDIEFVIHYHQPASAIAYYQQIGRAGRDILKVPKAYAILLVGDDDNEINRYFIMNAFPTENEMNSVINLIVDNPGISRNEIMQKLSVGQVWTDKVLKYLLVNGDIDRDSSRYYKTNKEWNCDMKRARIVSWFRWKELRKFNEYIETKQCYMKFLRDELDDNNTTICGHCANCLGHHYFE